MWSSSPPSWGLRNIKSIFFSIPKNFVKDDSIAREMVWRKEKSKSQKCLRTKSVSKIFTEIWYAKLILYVSLNKQYKLRCLLEYINIINL